MARILTVSNLKGGVGKTTSTVNLSACLAEMGRNVLVIDLDPQANCTSGLGIQPKGVKRSIGDVLSHQKLSGGLKLEDVVLPTKWAGLHVAPSHPGLASVELELAHRLGREAILKKVLRPIRDKYDYIILDTPPSLSLLTVNALTTVDDVVVSMLAEPWSLDGIEHLLATIQSVHEHLNPAIGLGGIIVIIPEPEPDVAGEIIARLENDERFHDHLFATRVRWDERVAEAAGAGMPVIHLDSSSEGAWAYRRLTHELLARVGDVREGDPHPPPEREAAIETPASVEATASVSEPADEEEPASEVPAVSATPRASQGAEVLVVDDIQASRELLRDLLDEAGYQPVLASGGAEALEILEEQPVSVVVTDVHMPGMDGLDLLEQAHQKSPHLPVILYTGDTRPSLGIRAFAHGAFYFLEKPIQTEQLVAIIEKAMLENQQSPAHVVEKAVDPSHETREIPRRGAHRKEKPSPGGKVAKPPAASDTTAHQDHPAVSPPPATPGGEPDNLVAITTRVGYVGGPENRLVYRGFDCLDLAAESTFEETCFLLIYGHLPTKHELDAFIVRLRQYRQVPRQVISMLRLIPPGRLHAVAALRTAVSALGTFDECAADKTIEAETEVAVKIIAQVATIVAAIGRLRAGQKPIDPDPDLSHAANLLYMFTGRIPDPPTERIMDISLILHADHGMNPATFTSMMTNSSQPNMYSMLVAGLSSLNGRHYMGANERALRMLDEIGDPNRVEKWVREMKKAGRKVTGVGHRLYRTYDPRSAFLAPLAREMAERNPKMRPTYETAVRLERVMAGYSKDGNLFANVHLYSGMIYRCMGIDPTLFTPLMVVSRVAGWAARLLEYVAGNDRKVRLSTCYDGADATVFRPLYARDVSSPPLETASQR